MLVELQPVGTAGVPLKVTAPLLPKFVPVIVTGVLTGPDAGEIPLIVGAGTCTCVEKTTSTQ
jgi:hypothetical protein